MSSNTLLISTGVANTASVRTAFSRLGEPLGEVREPDDIERAPRVVLPGVGTFGAAISTITRSGLLEPLRKRIRSGRPTLAICVGMQILFEGSEESPGVQGLGVLPGIVERFSGVVRVPQLGWNRVVPESTPFLEPGYAYFANSYCARGVPNTWQQALTDYDGTLVSAAQFEGILACQFHPELSGKWGERVLRRWLEATR